jgi:phosphoribosylglycinamide formyltransferase 2
MASVTAPFPRTVMLLGSGELGKEVAIAAQRLGCRLIAVDRDAGRGIEAFWAGAEAS